MSIGRLGCGKELNCPGYLGQCMVGRVSYLGKVKQANYHTHVLYTIPNPKLHTSQTLSFHNNLPYPPPYFGYPDWESVTLCKYQHYLPLISTYPYPSILIPNPSTYPTLPTVGKIPLPTLSVYPTYLIKVNPAYIPVPTSHYLLLHTSACIPYPILLPGLNLI